MTDGVPGIHLHSALAGASSQAENWIANCYPTGRSYGRKYLNTLTIRLRAYAGYPLPENFVEEQFLEINVGGVLDLDELATEIVTFLQGGSRRISKTVTETSWGASGSGANLIVDIPAVISGVAGLAALAEMVVRRMVHHGTPREIDGQAQAESARALLADDINIDATDIQIVEIEEISVGHRIAFDTPGGRFLVELGDRGLTRLSRE